MINIEEFLKRLNVKMPAEGEVVELPKPPAGVKVLEARNLDHLDPEIEDPLKHMQDLGLIPRNPVSQEDKIAKAKQAAAQAKEAVSGYSKNNGSRKAVEKLADAIDSLA